MEALIDKYHEIRAIKDKELGLNKVEDGKGHAIGYTRVSTKMQEEEGKSMDVQKADIENYCRSKNLILDEVVEEPAKSGADRNRPKLRELIEKIRPGTKLVVPYLDRLCRDTRYLLEIKEKLHEKGCSIYFMDRNLDTSDVTTQMMITIMSAFAEEERKAKNRTISNVMQSMSSKGILRTRPQYGWKVVNKEMVQDDEEQIVIQLIGQLIKEEPNISISSIIRKLEAINVKIRNAKRIYPTTIKNIIEHNNLR